jgi:hypothetical protein
MEFTYLAKRLIGSTRLDAQDRAVVKNVVYALDLDGQPDLSSMDEKWQKQMRMEASMVYLIGRYTDYLQAAEGNLEATESNVRLQVPDKDPTTQKKYNKEDRDAVLSINEEVLQHRSDRDAIKSLHRDLTNLMKIVIGRNQKLENLSVNYRRDRKNQLESGSRKDSIDRYEWKTGENNLRMLPPWNARGFHFKKQLAHFDMPPNRQICNCLLTWPDKFEDCLVCKAIDSIVAQMPTLDLGRQSSSASYHANCIDRDNEDKGVQIVRFTPKTRNWIVLQQDKEKIGHIADIERGFDLCIDKTTKKRKDGSDQVEYVPSFTPERCPLHEDDKTVALWLGQAYDLDKVVRSPTDEELGKVAKAIGAMTAFYQSKQSGRGNGGTSAATSSVGTDVVGGGNSGKSEPTTRSDEPAQTMADVDPNAVPECFAGLESPEKHEDGVYGFNDTLEKCLLCKHELQCADAKSRKGL